MAYDTIPEIEKKLLEIPAEKIEIGVKIRGLQSKLQSTIEKLGKVSEEAFFAKNTSYEKLKTDVESQIANLLKPLLLEGRELVKLEIELQEKLEILRKEPEFVLSDSSSSRPPSRKPPAPPRPKTPPPLIVKPEEEGSNLVELMEELNAPYLAKSKLKSLQTILWPSNPVWYKGLGNFKKMVQQPYLQLVHNFQIAHEEETGFSKELQESIISFNADGKKQASIYQKHIKETQEKISANKYIFGPLGKKLKKDDIEKIEFLTKKIDIIFSLRENIDNLKSQLFDIPEISNGLKIITKDPSVLGEGEKGEAVRKVAKSLSHLMTSDPKAFEKIVSSKIPSDILSDIFEQVSSTEIDKFIKNTITPNIDNKEYINILARASIQKSAAESTEQGAFFRGNSAVSKTAKFIFELDLKCSTFSKESSKDFIEKAKKLKSPLTVDPFALGKTEDIDSLSLDNQQLILDNRKALLDLVNGLLAKLISTLPPDQVALLAYTTVEAFETKFPSASKENSYEKIGGLIFLRYLLPPLIGNDWKVEGPKGASVPDKWLAGQRTAIMVSKMLQNLANNKDFSKEPYMAVFNPWITSNQKTMNDYFDKVLAQGKLLATAGDYASFASSSSSKPSPSKKGKKEDVDVGDIDLGKKHGIFTKGTASGSGLNCLIDSIGKGLGINTTNTQREEIRNTLISLKLAKKNEFLYNDQAILSAILQSLDRRPSDVNIFFISGTSTVVDNQTYNMGAGNTIYIHNSNNVHFSPMISQ